MRLQSCKSHMMWVMDLKILAALAGLQTVLNDNAAYAQSK